MAYCNFEEFYEYADLDNDAVSTSLVTKYINRAYNEITNRIGYVIASTTSDYVTVTETLDPTENNTSVGADQIIVNHYPIAEISSVTINGNNVTNTSFVSRVDRICIGTEAPISTFGTVPKSVTVVYKHGLLDTYKYDLARQLNLYSAILDFLTTPKGRDTMLDNSRYAEINHNDVRPNDMANLYITDVKDKVTRLYTEIGIAHKFF